jgi:hypothetical protein
MPDSLVGPRIARNGVDSPMESRLCMLLVLAGLPEPFVNHALRDETTGRVRYGST